ncbi:hypothetical protein PG994_003634 [Apiospora phragmitis]|uniref:AAA+ ATPase domain-containing protein n=1 Tax=Apiospora phragmitis TaxID=2905665 RepID=A0ABR1VYT0_9PEZI
MDSFLAGYLGHGLDFPLLRFLDRFSNRTKTALLTATTVGGAFYKGWFVLPAMIQPSCNCSSAPSPPPHPRPLSLYPPKPVSVLSSPELPPAPPGPAKPNIVYLPGLRNTSFFYRHRPFLVRVARPTTHAHGGDYNGENEGARQGGKRISVLCFGRSIDPIKQFLKLCRRASQEKQKTYVTVHLVSLADGSWPLQYKPKRALDTIHLDEAAKAYLDPLTQQFYGDLAIPYQRVYMFWGPPGTGKTSFAIAIAGFLDIPCTNDAQLQRVFESIEPRCIVLLEDVDSARIRWDKAGGKDQQAVAQTGPTLSGLLNVLDGVASAQNRVVVITANQPDTLDEALLRPGRVDKRIYFRYITPEVAQQMFLRILAPRVFARLHPSSSSSENHQDGGALKTSKESSNASQEESDEMKRLAAEFAAHISLDTLTRVQLQEYLLSRRTDRQKTIRDTTELVRSCRRPESMKVGAGEGDSSAALWMMNVEQNSVQKPNGDDEASLGSPSHPL